MNKLKKMEPLICHTNYAPQNIEKKKILDLIEDQFKNKQTNKQKQTNKSKHIKQKKLSLTKTFSPPPDI